ncbi:rCG45962 [Rattus norvegicus]|uniref:RCG45962 n=1 Tax=Rattus norvegicus TaxID=10116 RepID=A6ICK5_RAT|nr:rCG45962 [Rattus norvegicus]
MFLRLKSPSFWSHMSLSYYHSCGSVPLIVSLQGSQHMLCSCSTQLEAEARGAWQAELISAHIRRQREVCGNLQ